MKELVLIQLKDLCYYDDNFEYKPFLVEKDKDFESKYKKLVKICNTYEQFDEVEEFIQENFIKLNFEKRTINI